VKKVPKPDPDEIFNLVLQSFSMIPPCRQELSVESMCAEYDDFFLQVV